MNVNDVEKREFILRAAGAEFAAHGLAGARVDRIAAAAGVNKALIYYYFSDKQGLYDRVLGQLFTELETQLFPALDGADSLAAAVDTLLNAYFGVFSREPDRARLFARELAGGGEGILRRAATDDGTYFQRLREGIARAGNFTPEGTLQFLLSAMGLIIFPFMARPVFAEVFAGKDPEPLFAERRDEVRRILLAAYEERE